jgi:hypothetical protein
MSRHLELIIGIISITLFVGTLAAIPWLVRRMPADYFVQPKAEQSLPKKILRNALGVTLIAAGVAMLFLPGQGILTILVGLSAIDLPFKRRVIRKLLRQPKVRDAVQHLRARGGKPPLILETGPTGQEIQ